MAHKAIRLKNKRQGMSVQNKNKKYGKTKMEENIIKY